jgi:class 3 adenylate cyclase
LFTDFSNFTSISEQLDPEDLVSKLDIYFARFDEICSRHKLEKIKTIGDSHMSVGGIPVRNRTHPIDAVLAANEMQNFIRFMHEKSDENKIWKLRIGINSGELTAGVVGKKKFAFDVWGDTVNTASRFQDAGECGEINISKSTANAVEGFFNLEYRGEKHIKHKGEVEMYYVKSIKKELSIEGLGETPNMEFWRKYNELVDIKYLNF